ncbi:hypothetical protein LTR08_000943 [Meristemomyces frigidus]|nr:hypothetical protein LTR08_000943 [Meristemomyces frigidus]
MSDAASSSAAATTNSPDDPKDDDTHHGRAPPSAADKRKKNRQMFNRKRGDLLDVELTNLDILVYAELSAIYYMDCSFLRLIIRAFVQFVLLSPKPALFPEPPSNRPYIGAIFGANLLCLFLHALFAASSAGEATRGYLHGGLAIDFIGQKGPSSKTHLLLLDLLVLVLQLYHLSAHITRQKLRDTDATAVSVTTTSGRSYTAPAPSQDVDSEERGIRRSDEIQDIEMQTLNPSGTAANPAIAEEEESSTETDTLLSSTIATGTAPHTDDQHISDAFNSGQIILADLDIARTVKEQFWAYQTASPESVQSSREMRQRVIGGLLRWRNGGTVGGPAVRTV